MAKTFENKNIGNINVGFQLVASYIAKSNHELARKKNNTLSSNM